MHEGLVKKAARPLVSCIMPTCNRREFVPQALKYFLRQDYGQKELIIIDDGTDPVCDLLPTDERIRYVKLERKLTVGAKRNIACEQAKGEIVAHWDDDDWMADWRLSYQVEQLLRERADVCGLNRVFFFDPAAGAAWEYVFPGKIRPWAYGATLCYAKSFWRENPFRDITVGEDSRFVWSDPESRIVALPDNKFLAALVHAGNTSPKRIDESCWTRYPLQEIQELIGEDWSFYAPDR